MYSETDHTCFSAMSNSDQLFLDRDDQEDIGSFEVAERPFFKFQGQGQYHHDSVSSSSETQSRAQEEEKKDEDEGGSRDNRIESNEEKIKFTEDEEEESCDSRTESKEEKLKVKEDEEEDGFRTPKSLDHRIPEAKKCPSAPRKPKPSLKRKANSQSHWSFRSCRRNPLDLSKEVELLLYPTQHSPLSDSHQNNKNSRRQKYRK